MEFFTRDKPKIKGESGKKDGYSGWVKCDNCHEMIHENEFLQNLHCCPKCEHHNRLSAKERIALIADEGSFNELFSELKPIDTLGFVDTETYPARIKRTQKKSGNREAILTGTCELSGISIALGVLDFSFMGGSMGSVVGEKITLLIEKAIEENMPIIIVSTSGGARMQESTLSLMQMAKTAGALAKASSAGIPYISVLTNPTTGGVTASFASLGDLIFAEPNALICFAGPRVIEQTIGHTLPEGAQRAEFLLKHGMIDAIVKRHDLKNKLTQVLTITKGKRSPSS